MVRQNFPHRFATPAARAFTLIELLVVMTIIFALVGLLLPALVSSNRCGKTLKDSSQIRGIHQSWIVISRESEGVFPTPGLVDRQPDPVLGKLPGKGREDRAKNDTASLHSMCIMQNYYTPEICVGPTEPSGKVAIKDDYNWEMYNSTSAGPNPFTYWDVKFRADLRVESHVSYASMPIVNERQIRQWRDTMDSAWTMIGNRGVYDGMGTGTAFSVGYHDSITLQIHGHGKQWIGNVCFNDNHVRLIDTFFPPGVNYRRHGVATPDNIFRNDNNGSPTTSGPDGNDCWLVIVRRLLGTPDRIGVVQNSWD